MFLYRCVIESKRYMRLCRCVTNPMLGKSYWMGIDVAFVLLK
jgi:hypothetical protein